MPSKVKDTLVRSLGVCVEGSNEKRLPRSIIIGTLSTIGAKQVESNDVWGTASGCTGRPSGETGSDDDEMDTEQKEMQRTIEMKQRVRSGNARRTVIRAQNDWGFFEVNVFLPALRRTVKRINDESIKDCVSFIFSPCNWQIMATGSKRIRLWNGERMEFPMIGRKKVGRK